MCAWSIRPSTRSNLPACIEKEVVFFALGFETTMPSTALTILQAEREGIRNFSLFCNHITIIPAIKAILDSPELQIDGFLGPGHVSMVIGARAVPVYR
jgi:hydrogenase expression/formation protein HypD